MGLIQNTTKSLKKQLDNTKKPKKTNQEFQVSSKGSSILPAVIYPQNPT